MVDKPKAGAPGQAPPDLDRRRCVFRIGTTAALTVAAAAALYMAPVALHIADEAEAKGSKRKVKIKHGSRRRARAPSRRHMSRRRGFPTRR